jgi:hypothetical protein
MRALRASLAGTLILMLAVSLSVAVAGQNEADPMAPAYFTYAMAPTGESGAGEGAEIVEATDPRASGLLTSHMDVGVVASDELGFMMGVGNVGLSNDGGDWSGAGRFVQVGVEDSPLMTGMAVLTGEGGYDGLTLVLGQFENPDTKTDWGVIVPSDQVPTMPGLEVDEEVAAIPTKDVVVATQTIEKGTTIGPEVVSLRAVPIDEPNKYALTDPREVVGRVAAIDILESQMLAPNLLEPSAE